MKQSLLLKFLLVLLGLAGTLAISAQTPAPSGRWTFQNPDDLMAAETGNMTLTPILAGLNAISVSTVSAAGITSVDGPTDDEKAILLPSYAALKVSREDGAETSSDYSILMDIMVEDATSWNGLLQTNISNGNDGDLFIHNGQIGLSPLGGYYGKVKANTWHRIVVSNAGKVIKIYIDGENVLEKPTEDPRFVLDPWGFYLFCDQDNEMVDTHVSQIAFWESALSDAQVEDMGYILPPVTTEPMAISSPADLAEFAQKVKTGLDIDGYLTADIDLTGDGYSDLMIGTEGYPFSGTFDGRGHTITIAYDVSANYCGLFSFVNSATIKNLRLEGDVVTRGIHFGALIGYGAGTMLVENVVTNVNITGLHNGVTGNGGMIGALYGDITFNNCATLGQMGYQGSSMYCGFVAFATSGVTSTLNNCYTSCLLTEGTGTDYCFTFCRGTHQLNNCYYLNPIGEVQGIAITEEQIKNGSLCYKLNADQSDIFWTQALDGSQLFPLPDADGLRVYATGTVRCDGAELEDNPLSFTNTESYPTRPEHQFGSDGICIVCGMTDPNAVTQDADGYYLINNAEQMYWLSLKIQEGSQMKVRLTDDIDLNDGADPSLMLGTEAYPFTGTFDGQGHTIHYDYDDVTEKWRGLFAFAKDATIKNLLVEGTAFVTQIHYGALIGRANGTILVENVVTNVNITGARNGVTGDAGMVGANYADMTFNNCATLGEMGFEGSSMYSSYSGWSDNASKTTLNNCYTTCKLTEGTGTGNCFTLTHSGGKITLNNAYYLNTVGTVQGIRMSEDKFKNGELCFKLNGDQTDINWYQTLDEDEKPMPFGDHLRVYGAAGIYMNVTDETTFADFASQVIEAEKARLEETKAQKSLMEAYLEALDGLDSATDIDAFIDAFNGMKEMRDTIESCANAYAAYIAKVAEAKDYLDQNPELDNVKAQLLRSYLNDLEENVEGFANGSAQYILEVLLLSEEEIIAETALIDKKLTEAITYSTGAGTDITLLLTNADLKDGFNGWDGTPGTGTGTSETSELYAAECLAKTMDMYQTLSGLPNGIYELKVNGAFRPTPYNDYYNVNYAATLYANGIHNYFQTNIEDMISIDDAVDGENCNIHGPIADFAVEDIDGNVIGYTMQGIVSCCNAFQAGRYPNYVLCNVTDGQLTVGIRQPGTGQSRDWLGFGGIKLTYCGEMDKASESLDRVLASQSNRAKTILEVYKCDYNNDYALYPNFSQALRDELKATYNAAIVATENSEKYKLIEKYSSLFLQIYECKQAYIKLMDMSEEVSGLIDAFSELLSEEEFIRLEDLYADLTNGYMYGTKSVEEVNAINLNDYITFLPAQDSSGTYLLRSVKDFCIFASMVNGGKTDANAKLFVDVNLVDSDYPNLMIGNSDARYAGTFDGLGHTVTYSYEVNDNYGGLFRYLKDATIKNLRVEGEALVTAIHFGALNGYMEGNVLIENVITNVNITGERSGVTGDGGMTGALYGNVTFNNCATQGKMGNEGSSMYCGFVAFASSGTLSVLNNCYTTCELTEGTGTDYCYTFCRGSNRLNNCYYLSAVGAEQGTKMTAEQFQNGEVCYKLNGNQSEIRWFQTIGEDLLPVLDGTHNIVVTNEDGTYTGITEVDSQSNGEWSVANGQPIYNLAGQRLQKLQKGINIVGGKKVLVK